MVAEDGIRVGGTIVEKVRDGKGSGGGAFGLGGGNGTESDQHGGVNGAGIVEESADDFLDAMEVRGWERSGGVGRWGELDGDAIAGRDPGVGRVLGTGRKGVLEAFEGLLHIAGHGAVTGARVVIPVKAEAKVESAVPALGDVVEQAEGVGEVLGVFASNVANGEVVDA
jgi:hypothetical protein